LGRLAGLIAAMRPDDFRTLCQWDDDGALQVAIPEEPVERGICLTGNIKSAMTGIYRAARKHADRSSSTLSQKVRRAGWRCDVSTFKSIL
jgi:hypothetical protein